MTKQKIEDILYQFNGGIIPDNIEELVYFINYAIENENNTNRKVYLDKPEHIEAIMKMNEAMDEVKRDFIIKNFNSEKSAENCIINT